MSPAPKTSIWFLGTSPFAVPSLEALLADPHFSVDLVITQPDRPVGRRQMLTPTPIKAIAVKHGLNLFQPEDINTESLPQSSRPDFLVVVSFGQILTQDILDIAKIAPVNVHASLLPRWRGASPIHHTILAGDKNAGVTIQRMVKELDAGPILAQEMVNVDPRETVTTLHDRMAPLGARLLISTLTSALIPKEQDPSKITVCHKFKREDGLVDAQHETAEQIDRKVRGLTPWPGVTMMMDSSPLKILKTALEPSKDSTPLNCVHETVLHLVEVQPAGRTSMAGAEWARGRRGK